MNMQKDYILKSTTVHNNNLFHSNNQHVALHEVEQIDEHYPV